MKQLTSRHLAMIHRELQGATPTQLAREFGLTLTSVRRIRQSELYQEKLQELQRDMSREVVSSVMDHFRSRQNELAEEAIRLALHARSEAVRLKGVWEILDRLESRRDSINISIEGDVAKTLMEALRESGP